MCVTLLRDNVTQTRAHQVSSIRETKAEAGSNVSPAGHTASVFREVCQFLSGGADQKRKIDIPKVPVAVIPFRPNGERRIPIQAHPSQRPAPEGGHSS